MPPQEVPDADDAMEQMFKEQFGRDPSAADDIPVKDRKDAADIDESGVDHDPDGSAATFEEEIVETPPEPSAAGGDESSATPPSDEAGKEESLLDTLLDAPAKPAETAPAADPYEAHKVAANASEKTRDTFEKLKQAARERESAAREETKKIKDEAEALRQQLEEIKQKSTEPSEDLKKELEELRTFRRAYDTANDPEFRQKFDGRREANETAIYDVLKKGGLKDSVLEQLKGLPYEQRVDHIARWAEKLSPRDRLLVTSRLTDNETLELERAKAIDEAKTTATAALQTQQGPTTEEQEKVFVEGVVSALKPVLPSVDILQPKEVPANAPPKDKEALEAHNQLVAQRQSQLLQLIQDQTPATKGVLALAGILAPHYKAQVKSLKAEVAALNEQLAKIKKAGRFSQVAGGAPVRGAGPDVLDMSAEEAMEEAWKRMNG